MSRLVISLLGPLHITLGGMPVATPLGSKTQALLAYLAAEADRPHRREVLAGLLWPDQPDEAARHSLRQALHQLHVAFGAEDPPPLLITPQTLQLNPAADCAVDVNAFAAAIACCERHPHRRKEACRACVARLQHAAEFVSRPFPGRLLPQGQRRLRGMGAGQARAVGAAGARRRCTRWPSITRCAGSTSGWRPSPGSRSASIRWPKTRTASSWRR